MDDRILKQLYEPFTLQERRGVGNKVFKYVPSEDIVDRMNKAFKGSWSTEVQEKEIIEDQILICVRVSVTDPTDTSKLYWHDGYASHPIARYTSGPNNGKPVDIGNSFKSAMSKAIKTAVSKWGVALYLEKDDAGAAPSAFGGFGTDPGVPDKPNVPTPAGSIGGPLDFNTPPKTEEKKPSIPNIPDLPSTSVPPVQKSVVKEPSSMHSPPFDIPIGVVGASNKNSSVGQFANVENTEQSPSTEFASSDDVGEEFCTPVQQVAITTIMESNSLTFNELAIKALKREDNLPVSPEKAHYIDAVKIIQYGNELSKV